MHDLAGGGPRGASRDLVVVSDLHLGRGFSAQTKRWHELETFFYDGDFQAFCEWLCRDAAERGAPFALILNGDAFDLLRIEPEAPDGATGPARRFGLATTPAIAARLVRDILRGHVAFADALAGVLAAGHEVIFLPGNHDLELQWDAVHEEVRRAVAARLAARGVPDDFLRRLQFERWFFHEPGRIWIEHGCQYDPENAFRFPLRRRLAGSPELAATVSERDMPLGNFFQKYLYNAFGALTFIVPSSRANYRYFRFLLANRPRLLFSVARSHGRFLVQLLRRLARAPAVGWHREPERLHEAELGELAERSGLGDRLREVDSLRFVGADAAHAASGLFRQAAKLVATIGLVTLVAMIVWASAWRAVDALMVGFGWKTLLTLGLYLAFGAAAVAALIAAALRVPDDEPPRPLATAAERIANIVGVPLVTFGHTHEETVIRIQRPDGIGWYFNTGTWIAVFTHDVLVPREPVQYTFLRVRGSDGELLQWSPGRGRAIPVVLFEEQASGSAGG